MLARDAETPYVCRELHASNRDVPLSVYLVQEKQRATKADEEKTERAATAAKEMEDKKKDTEAKGESTLPQIIARPKLMQDVIYSYT